MYYICKRNILFNFVFLNVIKLARHIEILLLGNECVIVPGLGGFVAHHVVAKYDNGEELFLPPTKTLGFNPQLKMNDSLLAQSYVDAYDMSYPEAVGEIEDEVGELLETLDDEGSYELENLGRLYYDGEGKLNFAPCESGILSPGFYALSSFSLPLLDDNDANTSDKLQKAAQDSSADNNGNDDEGHSPKVIYIGTENGQKTLNISLKAIRNVAVAAVVMAAVFVASYPMATGRSGLAIGTVQSGFYEMFNPSHNNGSAKPAIALDKSSRKEAAKPVAQVAAKATTQTSSKPTVEDKPWSIVVCSHVSRRNAEELAGLLRGKGFEDVRVSTNGAVKVLYGHYTTKAEAHKTLNALVGSEYFKDAWLLEVKQ